MRKEISTATAIRAFFDKLGKGKDGRVIAQVIADAYGTTPQTTAFQLVISAQAENFAKLEREIQLSTIGVQAQRSYLDQLRLLSQVVWYSHLGGRYDTFHKEVVQPHIRVLTYLDDTLKLTSKLDDTAVADISNIVDQLEAVLNEISASSLPLAVKSMLVADISRIIFVLKNYETVGLDQAWQAASAAYTLLQREAPAVTDEGNKRIFGKTAVRLSALLGLITLATASLDQIEKGVSHAVGAAKQIEQGIELVETWRKREIPKLEDQRNK